MELISLIELLVLVAFVITLLVVSHIQFRRGWQAGRQYTLHQAALMTGDKFSPGARQQVLKDGPRRPPVYLHRGDNRAASRRRGDPE